MEVIRHIFSKDDISIDRSRIEAIKKIAHPKDKKSLQSFFGHIKFIRRSVPNFDEITKPINTLLKNDSHF
jgi:hypothetical protein